MTSSFNACACFLQALIMAQRKTAPSTTHACGAGYMDKIADSAFEQYFSKFMNIENQ